MALWERLVCKICYERIMTIWCLPSTMPQDRSIIAIIIHHQIFTPSMSNFDSISTTLYHIQPDWIHQSIGSTMTLFASSFSIGERHVTLSRSLPRILSCLLLLKQSIMTGMILLIQFQLLSFTVKVECTKWNI